MSHYQPLVMSNIVSELEIGSGGGIGGLTTPEAVFEASGSVIVNNSATHGAQVYNAQVFGASEPLESLCVLRRA